MRITRVFVAGFMAAALGLSACQDVSSNHMLTAATTCNAHFDRQTPAYAQCLDMKTLDLEERAAIARSAATVAGWSYILLLVTGMSSL